MIKRLEVWLYKEWRAQRTVLGGFLLLLFCTLGLGITWFVHGDDGAAMVPQTVGMIFAVSAMVGVALFSAPLAVRGEMTMQDDQFLRRLPAGLSTGFAAKVLFFLLVLVTAPVLGFLVSAGALWVRGLDAAGTSEVVEAYRAHLTPLVPITLSGVVLLFAVALWMPRGRLAFGALVLLVTVLGGVVFAVCDFFYGLAQVISWLEPALLLFPVGLLVAGASMSGRRGGGPLRSATRGVVALAAGLLPHGLWFAYETLDYGWPDLQGAHGLSWSQATTDGRWVVTNGHVRGHKKTRPFAIDLATGNTVQLGFSGAYIRSDYSLSSHHVWPTLTGSTDWFVLVTPASAPGTRWTRTLIQASDLAEGAPLGQRIEHPTTEDLRRLFRSSPPILQPGGRGAWILDGHIEFEEEDGSVTAMEWPFERSFSRARGYVLSMQVSRSEWRHFDLTQRRFITVPGMKSPLIFGAVGGLLVREYDGEKKTMWHLYRQGAGSLDPLPELSANPWSLVLLDDHTIAVNSFRSSGTEGQGLMTVDVRAAVVEIHPILENGQPIPLHGWSLSSGGQGTWPRDPSNRTWFFGQRPKKPGGGLLAWDPTDRALHLLYRSELLLRILAFENEHTLLAVEDYRHIVRIHLDTGRRDLLFPHREQQ